MLTINPGAGTTEITSEYSNKDVYTLLKTTQISMAYAWTNYEKLFLREEFLKNG